jgi:hypothetical protein
MMAAAAAASDRRNICKKFLIKHISTIRSTHFANEPQQPAATSAQPHICRGARKDRRYVITQLVLIAQGKKGCGMVASPMCYFRLSI